MIRPMGNDGSAEIDGFKGGGVSVQIEGAEGILIWLEVRNRFEGWSGDGEAVPLDLANLRELKQVIDGIIKTADDYAAAQVKP